MKRVIPLHFITCLIAIVAAPAWATARPNVLLIAADDLNDWVGCLAGHTDTRTANCVHEHRHAVTPGPEGRDFIGPPR